MSQYDVVVTSYEMLKGSMELTFQRMVWRTVTLDEGHRIKNMLTQLSKVCIKLRYASVHLLWEMGALLLFKLTDVFDQYLCCRFQQSQNRRQSHL